MIHPRQESVARWTSVLAIGSLAALGMVCGARCGNGSVTPPPTTTGTTTTAPTTATTGPPTPAIGPIGTGTGTIAGRIQSPYARLADSVVYVEAIPGRTFPLPQSRPVMDQRQIRFTPHLLPVLMGATVEFHNTDTTRHNVHSKEGPQVFDVGDFSAGAVKTVRMAATGITRLGCRVHHEMSAYIIVCQNPHFVLVTKRQKGVYELRDVPAGRWRVTFFHERLKPKRVLVTVPSGGTVRADFTDCARR